MRIRIFLLELPKHATRKEEMSYESRPATEKGPAVISRLRNMRSTRRLPCFRQPYGTYFSRHPCTRNIVLRLTVVEKTRHGRPFMTDGRLPMILRQKLVWHLCLAFLGSSSKETTHRERNHYRFPLGEPQPTRARRLTSGPVRTLPSITRTPKECCRSDESINGADGAGSTMRRCLSGDVCRWDKPCGTALVPFDRECRLRRLAVSEKYRTRQQGTCLFAGRP